MKYFKTFVTTIKNKLFKNSHRVHDAPSLDLLTTIQQQYTIHRMDNKIQHSATIISLIRVRNEQLILDDTLNHLATISDYIVALDDASTDNTFEILKNHPKVILILKGKQWDTSIAGRMKLETEHRQLLLLFATSYQPEWFFYSDADERFEPGIRDYLLTDAPEEIDAIRISLFDAYMTKEDCLPYTNNHTLWNFRKYFGPEQRNILMIWRNNGKFYYEGVDMREPKCSQANIAIKFYCQHYGKSLSIQHWEETCDYYVKHFDFDSYGKKWLLRKGKAIHELSDFGRELFEWDHALFTHAVKI